MPHTIKLNPMLDGLVVRVCGSADDVCFLQHSHCKDMGLDQANQAFRCFLAQCLTPIHRPQREKLDLDVTPLASLETAHPAIRSYSGTTLHHCCNRNGQLHVRAHRRQLAHQSLLPGGTLRLFQGAYACISRASGSSSAARARPAGTVRWRGAEQSH